jgi:hypothetical protein
MAVSTPHFGTPNDNWLGWYRIGSGAFNQLTPISAVALDSNHMALFGVGENGGVYTAWWNPSDNWQGWNGLYNAVFSQLTPIAAVAVDPNDLSLFGVGKDGHVYTSWFYHPPQPIPSYDSIVGKI